SGSPSGQCWNEVAMTSMSQIPASTGSSPLPATSHLPPLSSAQLARRSAALLLIVVNRVPGLERRLHLRAHRAGVLGGEHGGDLLVQVDRALQGLVRHGDPLARLLGQDAHVVLHELGTGAALALVVVLLEGAAVLRRGAPGLPALVLRDLPDDLLDLLVQHLRVSGHRGQALRRAVRVRDLGLLGAVVHRSVPPANSSCTKSKRAKRSASSPRR